jgi:hypothetical protein
MCDVSDCTYHGGIFTPTQSGARRQEQAQGEQELSTVLWRSRFISGAATICAKWTWVAVKNIPSRIRDIIHSNSFLKSNDNNPVMGLRCELETWMAISQSLALCE